MTDAARRSAYVHIPFCRHRCGYCNFTLVAGRDDLISDYVAAIGRELASLGETSEIDTLFFGGGTPSHLPHAVFEQLTSRVLRAFPLRAGYEWSVEANPADVTQEWVGLAARLGVTRVSLGVQSFDAAKLRILERDHDERMVRAAAGYLREAGIDVAIDLIFGAPGESIEVWQRDVECALDLRPEHISTYGLTYERGARFWGRRLRGELQPVDEELERRMYEWAIDRLTEAGWEHYEVSNFARPGKRCRHNEAYWCGEPYYGVGAGAASYDGSTRAMNHRGTLTYLRRVLRGESPVAEQETLAPLDRARERLVFGLRRLQGVDRVTFRAATQFDVDLLLGSTGPTYVEQGWLADDGRCVRLTREGLLISDALWPALLAP